MADEIEVKKQKKKNLQWMGGNMYVAPRDESFKALITSVLSKSNVKPEYLSFLLSDVSLVVYNTIFTSSTFDQKNNYEIYELLGDRTINKFIVWYVYNQYPQLNCSEATEIVAKILIKYGSKKTLSVIADNAGFWPFISATEAERQANKKSLLEDTCEAFIGATEYMIDIRYGVGVGYSAVYTILKSLYSDINISLKYEDLTDSVTRLTELISYYNKQTRDTQTAKCLDYDYQDVLQGDYKKILCTISIGDEYIVNQGNKTKKTCVNSRPIGRGEGNLQQDAKVEAATVALRWFKDELKVENKVKSIYLTFCS